MYAYEDIRHIHLEPTTNCNAGCPMCARNACGLPSKGLPRAELTAADIRSILPVELLGHVDGVDFCGAYGDPALTSELLEIIAYLRDANPTTGITIYSNGGVRSAEWWRALARVLGTPARVVFAIDGLAERNGIYRQGVRFAKVMDNAAAFIEAGGVARWEFLAFRHNEHDIEAARVLSGEMGFVEFSVKRTQRFLEPTYDHVPEFQGAPDLDRFPIWSTAGKIVGYLEPPENPALVNPTARQFPALLDRYGSIDELFSATPIRCPVLETSSVFIGAQGHAYPCCWTYVQATRPAINGFPEDADRQTYDLVQATGGFDAIDTRKVGLRAAVESELFKAIERSWSCGSVSEGKLRVCARACGTAFPAYFDQFVDVSLLPRSLHEPVSGTAAPVAPGP